MLADWHAVTGARPALPTGDRVHLRATGQRAYADLAAFDGRTGAAPGAGR